MEKHGKNLIKAEERDFSEGNPKPRLEREEDRKISEEDQLTENKEIPVWGDGSERKLKSLRYQSPIFSEVSAEETRSLENLKKDKKKREGQESWFDNFKLGDKVFSKEELKKISFFYFAREVLRRLGSFRETSPEAKEAATEIIKEFEAGGSFNKAIREAKKYHEDSLDETKELDEGEKQGLVQDLVLVLETRLLLDRIATAHKDDLNFSQLLLNADNSLSDCGTALLLFLDKTVWKEDYLRILDENEQKNLQESSEGDLGESIFIDEDAWWGYLKKNWKSIQDFDRRFPSKR